MACPKCESILPEEAKFCLSCGERISPPDPGRGPDDVSGTWLTEVLTSLGYEVQPVGTDGTLLGCRHPTRINVLLDIRRVIKTIGLMSPCGLKRSWGGGKSLDTALAKANDAQWRCTFTLDNDRDLRCTSFIHMGDRLTANDVDAGLTAMDECFWFAVRQSGLGDHLK